MTDPTAELLLDSEARLWHLVELRSRAGADLEALDERIWDLFGEERAVMFTDLAGFSRSVETFGILHFLQIIHEQKKLLLPVGAEHGGVLVKFEADSMMLTFRRADAALACAIAMQRACERHNARRKPEEQILLCVGLGFGRVLRVGEHDVYGREVNAASKLGEDTARAGDILATGAFREALAAPDAVGWEAIGEVSASSANWRAAWRTGT